MQRSAFLSLVISLAGLAWLGCDVDTSSGPRDSEIAADSQTLRQDVSVEDDSESSALFLDGDSNAAPRMVVAEPTFSEPLVVEWADWTAGAVAPRSGMPDLRIRLTAAQAKPDNQLEVVFSYISPKRLHRTVETVNVTGEEMTISPQQVRALLDDRTESTDSSVYAEVRLHRSDGETLTSAAPVMFFERIDGRRVLHDQNGFERALLRRNRADVSGVSREVVDNSGHVFTIPANEVPDDA